LTEAPTRVLLVARFDDAMHAHSALRRRALERLGCKVDSFDPAGRGGLLARFRSGSTLERLRDTIAKTTPEVVLVTASVLDVGTVDALRRDSYAVWANLLTGDPDGNAATGAGDLAAAYDVLFVPDSALASRLRTLGHQRTTYLPFACDPSVHRPMHSRDQFRANVVFVGGATPYRETMLAGLTEFGLAVWGPGWRRTALRDYCRGETLSMEEYVKAYAGATVGVNLHRGAAAGTRDVGCNQRLFEIAAIGVPQVAGQRGDLPRHFTPFSEVLVYEDAAGLRTLVKDALHAPAAAEQLAAAARRRALSEHTHMHRMRVVLDTVKGVGSAER
jgi:spore maturation protein CgeB